MPPLRYAILHHADVDEPHFDLLFETSPGSQLATWRSAVWPIEAPTEVTRLRDHRRLYLEYEGQISDHRGAVQRVTDGQCEVECRREFSLDDSDPQRRCTGYACAQTDSRSSLVVEPL